MSHVASPPPSGDDTGQTALINGAAYLNTIDAAKFCGLSEAQFHREVAKHPDQFKPIRRGPKCTRFKVSDLIAAMDESGVAA